MVEVCEADVKKWVGGMNHGLGEAPLAVPTLALCEPKTNDEEPKSVIMISCAPPKPKLFEANGSETCSGLDGAPSLFRLGMCFLRGKGVEQNNAKVRRGWKERGLLHSRQWLKIALFVCLMAGRGMV